MNVINKKNSVKKTKTYENNFERRHPDIAAFLMERTGGPFMRFAGMVARYNASLYEDTPNPCRNFFVSTKNRQGVGSVIIDNFWTSVNSGSTFVGSAFSDFEHIADSKTIRQILKDAVDLEYIYKDRIIHNDWDKTKRPDKRKTIRTYCYFPTPILLKSWIAVAEKKLEILGSIEIGSLLNEMGTPGDLKKHKPCTTLNKIVDDAIDNMG